MMRRIMVFALAFGLAAAALGQEAGAPEPGPEHEKLGYFVGKWEGKGEVAESPFGPGGTMTWKESCEWFEGRFAVVCNSRGSGPDGATRAMGILSYNADQGVYTYYGVDNAGMTMVTVPRGTLDGDTWTYDDEAPMGDRTLRSRYVIHKVSADSYTFRWEMEGEGGAWTAVAQGTVTRK